MNDKFNKLYNYLKSNGMTDLDAQSFYDSYRSDNSKFNKLYGYLKSNGMTDLDANSFKNSYFNTPSEPKWGEESLLRIPKKTEKKGQEKWRSVTKGENAGRLNYRKDDYRDWDIVEETQKGMTKQERKQTGFDYTPEEISAGKKAVADLEAPTIEYSDLKIRRGKDNKLYKIDRGQWYEVDTYGIEESRNTRNGSIISLEGADLKKLSDNKKIQELNKEFGESSSEEPKNLFVSGIDIKIPSVIKTGDIKESDDFFGGWDKKTESTIFRKNDRENIWEQHKKGVDSGFMKVTEAMAKELNKRYGGSYGHIPKEEPKSNYDDYGKRVSKSTAGSGVLKTENYKGGELKQESELLKGLPPLLRSIAEPIYLPSKIEQRNRGFKNFEQRVESFITNTNIAKMDETDAIPLLTKEFGRFGFEFIEGTGDQMIVRTKDGLKEIAIDLDNFYDENNISSNLALRDFLSTNQDPSSYEGGNQGFADLINADRKLIYSNNSGDNPTLYKDLQMLFNDEDYKIRLENLPYAELVQEVEFRNNEYRRLMNKPGVNSEQVFKDMKTFQQSPIYKKYEEKRKESIEFDRQKIQTLYDDVKLDPGNNSRARQKSRMFLSEKYLDKARTEYNARFKDINLESKSLADDYQEYNDKVKELSNLKLSPDQKRTKQQELDKIKLNLDIDRSNLIRREKAVANDVKNIEYLTGKYVVDVAKEGSFIGGVMNSFSSGISKVINAADIVGRNEAETKGSQIADNMTSEEKRYYNTKGYSVDEIKIAAANKAYKESKEALTSKIKSTIGDMATTKEYQQSEDRGIVSKALFGLAESIPAMATSAIPYIGGAVSFTALSAQAYSSLEDEMLNDPDFETTSLTDMNLIAVPYAIGMGALEKIGLSAAMSKNPLAKSLIMKSIQGTILKTVGKGSAELFQNVMDKEIKSNMAKFGLRIVGGALTEAETGATQSLVLDIGYKKLINEIKKDDILSTELTGGELFDTPDSFMDGLAMVIEDGIAEGIGGMVMSGAGAVSQKVINGNISLYDNEDVDFLKTVSTDNELRKMIVIDLKSKMLSGKITKSEAQNQLESLDKVSAIFKAMPDNLSVEDQVKSVNLMSEKQRLEKEIDGKDQSLVAAQKERITEIDNELQNISKDAFQKQTTGEVPVQPEARVGEEVVQGEPETRLEEITKEGQEITIDKPIITTNTTSEVDRVKSVDIEAEDGATFNIDGTKYEGGGLVVPIVSENTTAEEITPEMISDFVEKHSSKIGDQNTVKVGIYKFPNSNKVSIDLNIVAPESSRQQAIEFAKSADQESLFDLSTFENVKTGGTGANPTQFTDEQFKEIARSLNEGRAPSFATESEQSLRSELKDLYNRINKDKQEIRDRESWLKEWLKENKVTDVYLESFNILTEDIRRGIEKYKSRVDQIKAKIGDVSKQDITQNQVTLDNVDEVSNKQTATATKLVLNALPGVKIYIHKTNEEYSAAIGAEAEAGDRGAYDTEEGAIHINLSAGGNAQTVFHEAIHHALLKKGMDSGAILDLANGLNRIITDKKLKKRLSDFVSQYETSDQSEEYVSELGAIMAEAEIELTTTKFNQFKALIAKIFQKLGLPKSMVPFLNAMNSENAVEFINGLTRSLRTGEEVKVSQQEKKSEGIKKQANNAFNGAIQKLGIQLGTTNEKTGKTKVTNYDVASALNEYYSKQHQKISITDFSENASNVVSDYAKNEILFAISKFGENSGKGWYTEDYNLALDILSSLDNDISKDKNIKEIATAIIAVASNSTDVYTNLTRVIYGINKFKSDGIVPNDVGVGKGASAISSGIDRYNNILSKFDGNPTKVADFLQQIDTISNLKKKLISEFGLNSYAQALNNNLATDPEWNDNETLPMSVLIFGPKIGAFYSNLSGLDGTPTIDRWCIRTLYRYRGDMRSKVSEKEMEDFKSANGIENVSYSEAISLAHEHSKLFDAILTGRGIYKGISKEERNLKLKPYRKGSQIWKKAQGVVNDISEGIESGVSNKKQYAKDFRSFTKTAFESARDKVFNESGIKLSVSDVQAILWIYEKNLFGHLGVKQREDATYSAAAKTLTNKINSGEISFDKLISGDMSILSQPDISTDGAMGDIYGSTVSSFESGVNNAKKRNTENLDSIKPSKGKQIKKQKILTADINIDQSKIKLDESSPSVAIGEIYSSNGNILELSAKEINLSYPGKKKFVRRIEAVDKDGKKAIISFWRDKSDVLEKDNMIILYVEGVNGYGTDLINTLISESKEDGVKKIIADDVLSLNAAKYWEDKLGFSKDIDNKSIRFLDLDSSKKFKKQRTDKLTEPVAGNKLFNEPLKDAEKIAQSYMQSIGMEYVPVEKITKLDEDLSKRISDAYDQMENNPNDPEVKAAYEAMAKETLDQYDAILKEGYNVEINNNEPYSNSEAMIKDLKDNKRMNIFSTESGFGDEPITDEQRSENLLLKDSGRKDVNGETLLINDVFRFVHDFFGHAKLGNSFGPIGEENAWRVHSEMYSPEAKKAMTSETRGQNSFVNFSGVNDAVFKKRDKARELRKEGKIEEAYRLVGEVYEEMKFADQKVGLLPSFAVEEGAPSKIKKQKTTTKTEAIQNAKDEQEVNAAIDNLQKSDWYENADDTAREDAVREIKAFFGEKIKKAPSVAKILGKPKPETQTKTVDALRKEFFTAWNKASREEKANLNTKRKAIGAIIKSMVRSGKITIKQSASITDRASSINLDNPVIVQRFLDYVAKVFADANYQEKLRNAFTTRKAIRRLTKSNNQAEVIGMAKMFLNIDPSMVEDIDTYNEIADSIKNAMAPSVVRGEQVKFKQPANIADVNEYTMDELSRQEEIRKDQLLAEYDYLKEAGLISKDMTLNEIKSIIEEMKSPEAETENNKVNEFVTRRLDMMLGVVESIIRTGVNPITGEAMEISDKNKDILKAIIKMDLKELDTRSLIYLSESIDNFLNNGITSGLEANVQSYIGAMNVKALVNAGVKSVSIRTVISRSASKEILSIPLFFEKIFRGTIMGNKVMKEMGLLDLVRGKNTAEMIYNMIMEEYTKQDFYGKDFMTHQNIIERGMLGYLMRNVNGDPLQVKSELNRRIESISQSIDRLKEGNKDEQKLAEMYEIAYSKLNLKSKDIDLIRANSSKQNRQAVDWWIDQWKQHYTDLYDVSLSVYNTMLSSDTNYTPDKQKLISSRQTADQDISKTDSSFGSNLQYTDTKKSGVLMENSRSLGKNRYIDLNFDSNNANSLRNALVDIKTAGTIRQLKGFIDSENFYKLAGDQATVIKDRVNTYVKRMKGKGVMSKDNYQEVMKYFNALSKAGTIRALGGIGSAIKQFSPIINTLINSGRFTSLTPSSSAWIDRLGMPISNRGIQSEANIDSINKKTNALSESPLGKVYDGISQVGDMWLKALIQYPDAYVARSSFITYYLKSLRDQGLSEKIDWDNHVENKKASEYAQIMLDRQQNISDPLLAGDLFMSENNVKNMVTKIIMPFTSFVWNQRARMINDIQISFSKHASNEDKKIARLSLVGLSAEIIVFNMLGAAIRGVIDAITNYLYGEDDDEEEVLFYVFGMKVTEDNIQWLKTPIKGMIVDLFSPFPGITDEPLVAGLNKLFEQFPLIGDDEISELVKVENDIRIANGEKPMDDKQKEKFIEQEKEKRKFQLYEDMEPTGLDKYIPGAPGVALKTYTELYDAISLALTGKYETENEFGKKTIKYISDEDRKKIGYGLYFQIPQAIGLLPREAGTITSKGIRNIKRGASTENKKTKTEELEKMINRPVGKIEKVLIDKNVSSKNIFIEMKYIDKAGGFTESQQNEYAKLRKIISKTNYYYIKSIQSGMTSEDIIKRIVEARKK